MRLLLVGAGSSLAGWTFVWQGLATWPSLPFHWPASGISGHCPGVIPSLRPLLDPLIRIEMVLSWEKAARCLSWKRALKPDGDPHALTRRLPAAAHAAMPTTWSFPVPI